MKIKYIVNDLAKHPTKKYGKRQLSQIKRYVVHHFASMNFTTEQAAKYHVSKGWSGIGYTIVIGLDGVPRMTNDLDTICYGVANNNTASLSIALEGDWRHKEPPCYMLDALDFVINTLDSILGKKPVDIHRSFVNTECPGEALADYIRTKYPSPAPLKIPLSKFKVWWNKILNKDRGHL